MNMSLTLILRWKLCYLGLASISTMRCGIYEDAMKEYGLGPNNEILDGFRGSDPETKPLQYVFINLDFY